MLLRVRESERNGYLGSSGKLIVILVDKENVTGNGQPKRGNDANTPHWEFVVGHSHIIIELITIEDYTYIRMYLYKLNIIHTYINILCYLKLNFQHWAAIQKFIRVSFESLAAASTRWMSHPSDAGLTACLTGWLTHWGAELTGPDCLNVKTHNQTCHGWTERNWRHLKLQQQLQHFCRNSINFRHRQVLES